MVVYFPRRSSLVDEPPTCLQKPLGGVATSLTEVLVTARIDKFLFNGHSTICPGFASGAMFRWSIEDMTFATDLFKMSPPCVWLATTQSERDTCIADFARICVPWIRAAAELKLAIPSNGPKVRACSLRMLEWSPCGSSLSRQGENLLCDLISLTRHSLSFRTTATS